MPGLFYCDMYVHQYTLIMGSMSFRSQSVRISVCCLAPCVMHGTSHHRSPVVT